ncbi:MAG TPA: lysophospholipid acyltransferase family protein [Burkholderiales bacterium]|nr:lysophospholipid acyltransferase family protein [Burkholderiales bacterium]
MRWLRIARLALHLARGLFTAAFLFPFQSQATRDREIGEWAAGVLDILALRLTVHGELVKARPLMLVANHVSWLDIFAMQSVAPVRFVAKSEVRRWPLVGWLSARAGTLFIEQSRRHDTLRINKLVGESLRSGEVFAVFPEGTTTDGSRLLKFHASLLAPALQVGATLQPAAIRFTREDGTLCTEAAFDGVRSVWDVVLGVTRHRTVNVSLTFMPPLATDGYHRRELATYAREAIRLTLGLGPSE